MSIKTIFSAMALAALFGLSSCDTKELDERFTYVKPMSVGRNVLIEDFTGQRCVNCPNATLEIERLQDYYGADTVIAVGIHSGPFAKTSRGVPYPLYTETGDEYFNYWRVESQPKGVVDRLGTSEYTAWGSVVREELSRTAPLSLSVTASYNPSTGSADIDVTSMGIDGNSTGKLQGWLIEDGVVAFQYMPDGSTNREYVHNHVFRCAVNGTWGTDFSIAEGQTKSEHLTYALNEEWVPGNMSVVAFVYNNAGVLQVTKGKLQ